MKNLLLIAGLIALGAFILYRIVKSIIESIKREQFRKKNRETQFSGSAVKEEKGFWVSLHFFGGIIQCRYTFWDEYFEIATLFGTNISRSLHFFGGMMRKSNIFTEDCFVT